MNPVRTSIEETEMRTATFNAHRSFSHWAAAVTALCAPLIFGGSANSADPASGKIERFVGWVRFYGEFNLYETEKDMREGMNSRCISGSLPLNAQRVAPRRFNGEHVVIYGRRMSCWPRDSLTMELIYKGSHITNECRGDYMIFATSIEPYK
jgi:hypothetical protein